MRSIVLLCLFCFAAVAYARPGRGTYTDRYDSVNLEQILMNRRLLVPYLKCILDKGKCTPDGKELKSHIKEALEQDCAKCTAVQRSGTRRVMAHLINYEAAYWDQLKRKYDSTGKFAAKYEHDLKV